MPYNLMMYCIFLFLYLYDFDFKDYLIIISNDSTKTGTVFTHYAG